MARTEVVELTNMCMVYDGKKVLVQDKVNKDFGGITFPGGHIEKFESFTDSVIREVYEETGLTIESPQLCGIKNWSNDDGSRYIVFFYKTDKYNGEIKSSEEGEVFWLDMDELTNMNLSNDMEDMIKVFLDDNLSEFYYYKEDNKWVYELK